MHAYNVGMRLSKKQIEDAMHESKEDDHNSHDIKFKLIKQTLTKTQNTLRENIKFANIHYGNDQKQNKFITPIVSDTANSQRYGFKFFYSSCYEKICDMDTKYNIGYKINDFFIYPKFKDIKTEIFGFINQQKWDKMLRSVLLYLRCEEVKKLRATNVSHMDHLEAGDIITVSHILSILIYANNIELQRDFSSTYFKLRADESLQSVKERHSRYGNWAKYLFETVHFLGQCTEEKIFYHAMDGVAYFTGSAINFNHCISASSSFIVTTFYSMCHHKNNGLILHLSNTQQVQCFDCRIFSDFGSEQEYLLDASCNPLQIESIYHVALNRRYCAYLESLRIIDMMFSGFWMKTSSTPTMQKLMSMLFTNELKNWLGIDDKAIILQQNVFKLPEYIELSFHCFLHKLQRVTIDIASFMKAKHLFVDEDCFGYSWLRSFVVSTKYYFVNLSILIPLLPKCKSLTIANSVSLSASTLKYEFSQEIIQNILKFFKSDTTNTELARIKLSGFDTSVIKIEKNVEKYKAMFQKQGWHLQCAQDDDDDDSKTAVVMKRMLRI